MDKTPDQLKMDNALWTRKADMELIEQETGMSIPVRTVDDYLKRCKMSHMQMLQKIPQRVTKYIQHKKICYAA